MAPVQAWSWIQHHRWLSVAFIVIVVIGTAGGTAWAVFLRTVASPVSLRAALRLYHHDEAAADATGPSASDAAAGSTSASGSHRVLSPGVYPYRTTGGESLSILGESRSFPVHTDIVVSDGPGACTTVSWVPIVQHTETTTACPAAGHAVAVSDFVTHEVISGTITTTVIDCPSTMYLVPPLAQPGARWSAICHQVSPAENVVVDGTVVDAPSLEVGGRMVPTLHVRLTLDFVGIASGTSPTDYWISTAKGLIVRQQETTHITQQGVRYTEEMAADLLSLTPAG